MVIVYQEGFGNGPLGRELFAKQTFESSTLPFFFSFFFSLSTLLLPNIIGALNNISD